MRMGTEPGESGLFPAAQEAGFSRDEEKILEARLFALLYKQARLKTQGDHATMREEAAAELLRSLVFTLRAALSQAGLPMRALLSADLWALLQQGQAFLQQARSEAEALYRTAVQTVRAFENRSLLDTLAGVGLFFRQYDVRLYAHCIPAHIDYQLCLPVPQELAGALYVLEYLKRMLTENEWMTRFAPGRAALLLSRVSPAYRELLINLYEPAMANAVCLTLLGQDASTLEITRAQAAEVFHVLSPLPAPRARARLAAAARLACARLSIADLRAEDYHVRAAQALYPRLLLSPQSAAGVCFAV